MNTKIHIVDCEGILKIVQSHHIKDGCIKVRHYEDDGDSYYDEPVPVKIKETFSVITSGQFIRNYEDSSKLNACTMSSGGMREINRLAYSYSVVVMTYTSRGKVWESDLIYSVNILTLLIFKPRNNGKSTDTDQRVGQQIE
jgi:hypothetical protein